MRVYIVTANAEDRNDYSDFYSGRPQTSVVVANHGRILIPRIRRGGQHHGRLFHARPSRKPRP